MKNLGFILGLTFILYGCGGIVVRPAEVNPTDENLDKAKGFFHDLDFSKVQIKRVEEPEKETKSEEILPEAEMKTSEKIEKTPQNPQKQALWLAALDALRIMPLLQVNEAEGSIITEWLPNPHNAQEQIKVQLFIKESGTDLDVVLFKRRGETQEVAEATALALKEKILQNAGLLSKPESDEIKEDEKVK